jgi:hypothetical protein
MPGVFLRQGENLVAMTETPYEAESVLQELLERYPALLAADDDEGSTRAWLLIRREAGIVLGEDGGPRGWLDHVFVDAAGVPTLVEVKRAADSRVRREVVGQMLDYAANAATYWRGDKLRALFEERCAADGVDAEQQVLDAFPDVTEVDTYWELVRTNLAAGRLRLAFVADAIPPELQRIVEFLNEQMTQTEVVAIEVRQYRDATGAHQTLVPRILGQTEAARQVKGDRPRWDRESVLATLGERRGSAVAAVGRRLLEWVDARGDLAVSFRSGTKDGSFQAGYWEKSRYLWPFVMYTHGRIEIQFVYLARRPPFNGEARRDELRDRLMLIAGVDLPPVADAKRPSFDMAVLTSDESFRQFTDTLDWVYELANRTSQSGDST